MRQIEVGVAFTDMCTRLRILCEGGSGHGHGHGLGTGVKENGEWRWKAEARSFYVVDLAEYVAEKRGVNALDCLRWWFLSRRLRSSRQRRPFAGKCSAGRKKTHRVRIKNLKLIGSPGHNAMRREGRTDLIAQPSARR